MNVTYMFRASNREARGLPTHDQDHPAELSDTATVLDGLTKPGSQTIEPKVALPLLLKDRVDSQPQVEAPDRDQAEQVTPELMQGPAKLPVKYVATQGRIILVAKARGGIGATTVAVNLAVEIQAQAARRGGGAGGRVALIDLDVQLGNAGTFLDLVDRGGMLALARLGPEPDTQAVRHAMVRHKSGLGVLAAPITAVPFEAFDVRRIASILDALATENDVVVVDLPPALIEWLEPLLARAERLLMVTDLAVTSITRARRVLTLMTEEHPQLPVEIVVAQEKKPFRMGRTHLDAQAALGHPLRHWLPNEAKLARQALDRGEPLVQLAPRCGWSKAIKAVATRMQTPARADVMIKLQGSN